MALLQHFVIIWMAVAVFLLLLCLKLGNDSQFNWFVVFIPLLILDTLVMAAISFRLITHLRGGIDIYSRKHMFVSLFMWGCFTLFQILLCLKLDILHKRMPLYYVFIPLWIILLYTLVEAASFQAQLISSNASRQSSLRDYPAFRSSNIGPDSSD